jgi:hypothetical protein
LAGVFQPKAGQQKWKKTFKCRKNQTGWKMFLPYKMATAVPPGLNIKINAISGRHAPQHSLDFFVSFFIKKKRKIKRT